ncbi:MAG: radical SAM protein [Clostridia bacterium]|nr:radical SAM protein [Clostridia bacterium]
MEKSKIRKDAYMVFGYACNQKCICCPCEKDQRLKKVIEIKELQKEIDRMVEIGVTDVTVSGGEPTVYPNFFEVITYLVNKDLNIHILSNSEKFANIEFAKKFVETTRGKNVTVTTTFHSYKELEHEKQNGSKGSFNRSLNGLKFLDENNIQVSLKQCITSYNYKDLKNFIKFLTDNFSARAEIQFWGIDLCGMDEKSARKYFVEFKEIKPYIEEALDYFESINTNRNQLLTLNNLPLCMCDCYYWNYFTLPSNRYYIDYKDQEEHSFSQNFGLPFIACKSCNFAKYCKGTYLSVYDMFGNSVIEKPANENVLLQYKPKYIRYNEKNINKLSFSIYCAIYLTAKGLMIVNKKSNYEVNIRLRFKNIVELINSFDEGIEKEEAEKLLKKFGIENPENTIEDWMLRGIIE